MRSLTDILDEYRPTRILEVALSIDVPGISEVHITEVVMNIVSALQCPELHKIYFDNYFTSFRLINMLSEMGVRATRTT